MTMTLPLKLQEFLDEMKVQVWLPVFKSENRMQPIRISGLQDLLHLPSAVLLCVFPEEGMEDWPQIKALFFNIMNAISLPDYVILFGKKSDLHEWMGAVVSRTSAKKILSFGLDLNLNLRSTVSTKALGEVLQSPSLKQQVWKDVRKLCI